jgi:propionyl-CoA carboxylase alpha chain
MVHPRFIEGDLTTNFIADEFPDGFHANLVVQDDPAIAVVVAASVHHLDCERAGLLSDQLEGHEVEPSNDWIVAVAGQHRSVQVSLTGTGFLVELDGQDYHIVTRWSLGDPLFKAVINDVSVSVQVEPAASGYRLFYRGAEINARVISPRAADLVKHMLLKPPVDMSKFLVSPMPGLLVKLSVNEGQEVKEGEELAVVEAMKMENSLPALQDGIVGNIEAQQGDSLAVDQIILEFK